MCRKNLASSGTLEKRSTRWRSRGFTVAELLIAVSIVGILLALMLPQLGKIRKSGDAAACIANQRQWGIATSLYLADNGTFPAISENELQIGRGFESKVADYLESDSKHPQKVGHCPGHSEANERESYSYRVNYYLTTEGPAGAVRPAHITNPEPNTGNFSITQSRVVLMFEVHVKAEYIHNAPYWAGAGKAPFTPWEYAPHGGNRWNFLMADGHVESIDGKELKGDSFSAWERIGPPSAGRNY